MTITFSLSLYDPDTNAELTTMAKRKFPDCADSDTIQAAFEAWKLDQLEGAWWVDEPGAEG